MTGGKRISKKDARNIINVLKKELLESDINEQEKDSLLLFGDYLEENHLGCIVTNKEKVIHTFGANVEKYKNKNVSEYMKECINDDHTISLDGDNLEVLDDILFPERIHYFPIKVQENNIGSIIFINRRELYTKKQMEFILKF